VFDRNSDGYVSKSELYHTLKELGVNLSLEELNNKMKEADINQDGCIDYAGIFFTTQLVPHSSDLSSSFVISVFHT
jgi:Ca2+-binding EF-hand superfamily protein